MEMGSSKQFLKNIPQPIKYSIGETLVELIRSFSIQDRDLTEKGTRAYTSMIRAYGEHQCQYIFRSEKLNLGAIATSYALLRLPKMPELKKLKQDQIDFVEAIVDYKDIKYSEKYREKARMDRVQKMLEDKKQHENNALEE